MNQLLDIYLTFTRVGLFMFGGGYTMLPLLQREVVDRKQWITETELLDFYTLSQCIPGAIAINTGTFIGYKRKGVAGGILAALGTVTPSLVIITVIAMFLTQVSDLQWVQHAFSGIRIAVCALVCVSIVRMIKKGVVDIVTTLICVGTFISVAVLSWSPVIAIVASGLVGVLSKAIRDRCARGKEGDR